MTAWKMSGAAAVIFSVFLLAGCGGEANGGMSNVAPPTSLADKTQDSEVVVDNGQRGETVDVGVISWRDLPFQTVKHQAYDYSCGSAAVATLVTYTYGMPTTEADVFKQMFARGNQNKIRREGFSMLDMSNYLNSRGLDAKGVRITEDKIKKYKVPFIALVNNKGYNHFVVVKTLAGDRVLVGDPNTGNTEYSLQDFARIWNGLALIVTNDAIKAREAYNNRKEWRFARAHAPLRNGNDTGAETADLPVSWQIAPTGPDILPAAMLGLVATSTAP
ncbi:MAG: C39 family peptidase [Alphaproteobacteria bacterium]|nr:C39 family peptidase [Alphaproteobacteria bacterium]